MEFNGKKVLSVLLSFVMVLSMFSGSAFAMTAVDSVKTITVNNGESIQDAIAYIDNQDDKTGWTIVVEDGTYSRFTVLSGLDGLTVKAADGASVRVNVLDGSDPGAQTSGAFPNTGGVAIRDANDVTLEGLTFDCETVTSPWYAAAVSNYSESTKKGDNLTVKNCKFNGAGSHVGVFINTGTTKFKVIGNTFSNLKEAISMYGDGTVMAGAEVSGNTMTNCSFAIHGYYGGTGDAGTLSFVNNKVTGSAVYSKIVIQDQTNTGALKVDVSGNTLTNAVVGLVNLRETGETVSDVLDSNTMDANSFYVEAVEPGTIDFYTSYQAPEDSVGYWELVDDTDIGGTYNPDGALAVVREAIVKANQEGSHTLNITGIPDGDLIRTFTWFKDAIYWVTDSDKTSYPGLEKWIVSGDDLIESDDVGAGHTVDFQLKSNVPEDLTNYLEADAADAPSTYAFDSAVNGGSYMLAFHDVMDSNLILDENSITLTVNGKIVEDTDLYAVLVPGDCEGCTFEVVMDLVKLYQAGYFDEEDFGTAEIVVNYSATVNSKIAPGNYLNTAWVEYEGNETEKDTVDVTTYGIDIFKYDQADANKGLKGAEFEIWTATVDGDNVTKGELVQTLTTDADGYALIEGLDAGTYAIYETKAPEGYAKSDEPIVIVVPDDADSETYIAKVKFANTEIPHTGGTGTNLYTFGGAAILLAAAILFVISRKKKVNEQ